MKATWTLLLLGLCLAVEAQKKRKKNFAAPSGYGNPWPRLPYPSKKTGSPKDFIYGHCSVMPNFGAGVREQIVGNVDLRQPLRGGPTEMRVNLTGFNAADDVIEHGFHIHEYGDLSAGCSSAGGHYNPFGVFHGAPSDPPEFRHFGDLGNIKESKNGEVQSEMKDYLVSLLGPFSVLGRGVVVHEGRDDLGRGRDAASARTGNAGSRLACCTIGLSDGSRWQTFTADEFGVYNRLLGGLFDLYLPDTTKLLWMTKLHEEVFAQPAPWFAVKYEGRWGANEPLARMNKRLYETSKEYFVERKNVYPFFDLRSMGEEVAHDWKKSDRVHKHPEWYKQLMSYIFQSICTAD